MQPVLANGMLVDVKRAETLMCLRGLAWALVPSALTARKAWRG